MQIMRKAAIVIMIIMINTVVIGENFITTFAKQTQNSNSRNAANVAVLLYSFEDLFLQDVRKELEKIQKENPDKVKFTFYDGKNNIAKQNEILDSLLRSNEDLIIANLADVKESRVEDFVNKVKVKETPLIVFHVDPKIAEKLSKNYNKVVFITPNVPESGFAEGGILVDLWKADKNSIDKNGDGILQYILLEGEANNLGAIERSKYAIKAINDSGIETEELAHVNANWLKDMAKNAMDSLLLRYSGKVEAVISNNDAMAIGAIEALQKYGYNTGDKFKYIPVVGIDAIPEAKDLVDKGFMEGTVIQDPKAFAEAYYAVGINLINNENPLANTDYKFENGEVVITLPYDKYVKKTSES
ncbi:galactose ABC transporter substrate-binding protein [Clostridium saccharoperbutylacetonicum]|uniref:galactose ABC transporter substrate-binding protein n=1 Tax=Clostridium saccharoperbutylacetonicum TaxID=36745 RepID=UPI0039EC8E64